MKPHVATLPCVTSLLQSLPHTVAPCFSSLAPACARPRLTERGESGAGFPGGELDRGLRVHERGGGPAVGVRGAEPHQQRRHLGRHQPLGRAGALAGVRAGGEGAWTGHVPRGAQARARGAHARARLRGPERRRRRPHREHPPAHALARSRARGAPALLLPLPCAGWPDLGAAAGGRGGVQGADDCAVGRQGPLAPRWLRPHARGALP
eukprot:285738-Rhodomonas_salina.1